MTQDLNHLGRVYSLDQSQEQVLKQVWTYLFHLWNIPVDGTNAFDMSTNTLPTPKKKKSMFGKLSSSSSNSKVTTTTNYTKDMIHDSLKTVDPVITQQTLWDMLRTDNPDNLILRFVRARKWDTDKSMGMVAHTLKWRKDKYDVDKILYNGEHAAYDNNESGFIKNLELQKATISGYDLQGRPIVLVRPKLHHTDDQTEEEVEKYCLLIIEQTRLFLKDPVDSATIFFDLTGFSMSNMDYLPVKFLISCFEAHYPECLGHLFIHKAPWIFPPIWNIIKKWLDPVVASKVVFTSNVKDLNKYIEIDHIPSYLGGESEVDLDNFEPVDGSHDDYLSDIETRTQLQSQRKVLIEKFIELTIKWIETNNQEQSQKLLNEKIEIGLQLSQNYSNLDPYIRSRSNFDISGTLDV